MQLEHISYKLHTNLPSLTTRVLVKQFVLNSRNCQNIREKQNLSHYERVHVFFIFSPPTSTLPTGRPSTSWSSASTAPNCCCCSSFLSWLSLIHTNPYKSLVINYWFCWSSINTLSNVIRCTKLNWIPGSESNVWFTFPFKATQFQKGEKMVSLEE